MIVDALSTTSPYIVKMWIVAAVNPHQNQQFLGYLKSGIVSEVFVMAAHVGASRSNFAIKVSEMWFHTSHPDGAKGFPVLTEGPVTFQHYGDHVIHASNSNGDITSWCNNKHRSQSYETMLSTPTRITSEGVYPRSFHKVPSDVNRLHRMLKGKGNLDWGKWYQDILYNTGEEGLEYYFLCMQGFSRRMAQTGEYDADYYTAEIIYELQQYGEVSLQPVAKPVRPKYVKKKYLKPTIAKKSSPTASETSSLDTPQPSPKSSHSKVAPRAPTKMTLKDYRAVVAASKLATDPDDQEPSHSPPPSPSFSSPRLLSPRPLSPPLPYPPHAAPLTGRAYEETIDSDSE